MTTSKALMRSVATISSSLAEVVDVAHLAAATGESGEVRLCDHLAHGLSYLRGSFRDNGPRAASSPANGTTATAITTTAATMVLERCRAMAPGAQPMANPMRLVAYGWKTIVANWSG